MLGAETSDEAAAGDASVLRLRVPATPGSGKMIRDDVIAFAGRADVAPRRLENFLFAIGEAVANAMEHAGDSAVIDIRCRIDAEKIVATVIDSGRGFTPGPATLHLPEGLIERGRGIPIMRTCSDIFALRSVPGRGTAIVIGSYIRLPCAETSAAS